jgi:cell division protein FtsZ
MAEDPIADGSMPRPPRLRRGVPPASMPGAARRPTLRPSPAGPCPRRRSDGAPKRSQLRPGRARMPRVEDFPPVVKAESRHRLSRPADHEEKGPMGLLKRLTNA